MLILAGDIGGTKSWLRVINAQKPRHFIAEHIYPSQNFDSLHALIQQFKSDYQLGAIRCACLGLPGPVRGAQAQLTNLPWFVDACELQQYCAIDRVEFINDFQAAALGIDTLSDEQLLCLQAGAPDLCANRLVVGAGTGLGVAPVMSIEGTHLPQACEGGHMDFAPTNELQQRLLKWLWQLWPHVSYERLLSGSGLQTLYAFFAHLPLNEQDSWPQPELIQQLAEQGETSAIKALHAFVQIYGSYIGNLVLLWPAHGGVYIVGGIAGKIESWMRKDFFLRSMCSKGRMRDLVSSMPVYLVREPALGLMGALLYARNLAG